MPLVFLRGGNIFFLFQPRWNTGPWSNCTAISNGGSAEGSGETAEVESDEEGSGDGWLTFEPYL